MPQFLLSVECDFWKLHFRGGGKSLLRLHFLRRTLLSAFRIFPPKSRSLRRRRTQSSPAVQKRPPSKKKSGKGAGRWPQFPCQAKTDDCDSGSHPVCSSWSFCVLQQLEEWRRNCPLAPIVNIPHKQWPGLLPIVHSVFICESHFFFFFCTMCKALLFTGAVLKVQVQP